MGAITRQISARKLSLRIGICAVLGLVGLVVLAVTAQNGVPDYIPGVHRTLAEAAFTNVGALQSGDDVRIADVRAGYVQSIALVNGQPVVSMKLDGGRPVYADASAVIRARSGLGQKYVDLNPGTPSAGPLGSSIVPTSHTLPATDLDDVLSTLDAPTRQGLSTTLRQLGGGLAGRGQDLNDGLAALPSELNDVAAISNSLSTNNGSDLASMLQTANTLSQSLAQQSGQLAALTRDSATTFNALAAGGGSYLATAIQSAPGGLAALKTSMEHLRVPLAETRAAAIALRPGAEALGSATPDLRGFLQSAVPPLNDVEPFASMADPALDQLTPALGAVRPLVEQIGQALDSSVGPLSYLAVYRGDLMSYFQRAGSALHLGYSSGHWLRISLDVNQEMLTSNIPVRSPLTNRQAYPAPGAADSHNTHR